ncbi:MAG: flippase [Chloroflexi bacterium]|nr:flippase [Chloroflexota bacterium]
MKAFTELARNSALSLVLNVSTRAANALMFIFIGRRMGVSEAGIFQLATTYLLIFSVLTRGLDELVVRQVARFPRDTRRYFVTFMTLRFGLNVVLYGLLTVVVCVFLRYPTGTLIPILIVSAGLVSDSLISGAGAVMLGQRRFIAPTLVAVGVCLLRLTGGAVLLSRETPMHYVAALWWGSSVVGMAVLVPWVGLQVKKIPVPPDQRVLDWSLVRRELSDMLPFVVNGFLMAIEFQIDTILLSILQGESEVGWYGAATTIVSTLAMMPQAYRLAVYPLMASYAEERQKLVRLYKSSLRYLGTLVLPMVAGLVLLAPAIIPLIFESEFLPSVGVLQSLSIALIFTFLNVPNVRMMFVHNRQGWVTWMMVGSMAVNVALNLWLTPLLGARGAALARICSSALFFFSNYLVLRFVVAKLDTSLIRLLWRSALATALMCGAVLAYYDLPVWAVILIGIVVYCGALVASGGIPRHDRQLVRQALQDRRRD